jgi:hypothetical protein
MQLVCRKTRNSLHPTKVRSYLPKSRSGDRFGSITDMAQRPCDVCSRAQSKVDIGPEERASTGAIMNRLWRFLREKRNREILGWIGGGLVVLATGIWTVTVYLFPAQKAQETKPTEVEARCGSVAVGGSVTGGSTVRAGSTMGADCSTRPK